MVAVRVITQNDLDVRRFESELLDRLLNRRDVPLVRGVDQDVSRRSDDQERAQRSRTDVIDAADDFVWRKRGLLIRRAAHIAGQYR